MKIRQGFVSNSSSSSFVVLGIPVALKDITQKSIDNEEIYVAGKYLSDGIDFFQLNHELFNEIVNNEISDLDYYLVYELFESGSAIDLRRIPKECRGYSMDIDYHTTTSVQDLKERYFNPLSY